MPLKSNCPKFKRPKPGECGSKIIEKTLALLGLKATDKVTGFTGIITSTSFDLYGCVQVVLTPTVDKDGKRQEGIWYDITCLKITSSKPVIEKPNFNKGYIAEGKSGCAEKPIL